VSAGPLTTIFTLASGRSGTHYLSELVRRNARDCAVRHETYGCNPSMFGRPIYDRAVGRQTRTRALLERKRWIIERSRARAYVETSHAFLKSWSHLACEFFPRLKLVHLVRDPLEVAKSEAYREALLKRLRIPFCHYRAADGHRYFLWSLTGLEPIFKDFDVSGLTRLQWYLIQWIEIENRAMQLLDDFGKGAGCFTLHSPHDLNNIDRVSAMLDFLELPRRHSQVVLAGRRNKNWRATAVTDDDRRLAEHVWRNIPSHYLAIFRREPFRSFPWIDALLDHVGGISHR
jgi:hypothetical protein